MRLLLVISKAQTDRRYLNQVISRGCRRLAIAHQRLKFHCMTARQKCRIKLWSRPQTKFLVPSNIDINISQHHKMASMAPTLRPLSCWKSLLRHTRRQNATTRTLTTYHKATAHTATPPPTLEVLRSGHGKFPCRIAYKVLFYATILTRLQLFAR